MQSQKHNPAGFTAQSVNKNAFAYKFALNRKDFKKVLSVA